MATKKLIIEAEVKTDQLDKAVAKLGELKDLGRGLKIQYDIDGKPLDVVIDKTLNLSQQVKVLTAELRKTKEGTAEFTLLNSKLNNTKDDLTRVNTKSRELFSTLSLIPGPIGDLFGKLNGVVGLLKTFSGFSFKDLNNQLKGFNDDLNNIIKGFLGIKTATEETNQSISQNTSTTNENTQAQEDNVSATDEGTTATNAGNAATQQQIDLRKKQSIEVQNTVKQIDNQNRVLQELSSYGYETEIQFNKVGNAVQITGAKITDLAGETRSYTLEQLGAVDAAKDLTGNIADNQDGFEQLDKAITSNVKVTKQLTLAQEAAIFTSNALSIALKGLGIGLVIAAVVFLFDALVKVGGAIVQTTKDWIGYKSSAELATIANEQLASSILILKRSLDETQQAIKDQTDLLTLQAKIAGESEEQLYKIAVDGYNLRVQANKDGRKRIESEYRLLQFNTKITEEERVKQTKALEDELVKNSQQNNDLLLEGKKLVLNEQLRIEEKKRNGLKKINKDVTNDNEKANALLLKLQQENSVNTLNEERKKQDAQLKIDKENEEREIKNLKLSKDKEELRAQLLEQVRVKYGLKIIDLNKKRQEEDNKSFDESQKKIKEYNDKVFEIMNAADESEIGRNKATLERKYADDVAALQKDTEFQKQSLEEKIRIILLLEKAKNQAIQKLDDDDAQNKRDKNLKKLDDELKFLQIRGDALIEGTKRFYDNQRAILKTAEKKELADLEDRAIKEKLTEQQIADAKEEIRKKYLKMAKDITQQELQNILQAAQATLGVAQTIAQDIGKVAQIEQQVAMEEATKRYIKQNELDKKTITNQEQLEAKLLENKKKFAKEEDDIKKKAFEENKKIQIAQAIIATLQSAVGAFSSLIAIPIVGPVLAPIAAAAALVFGYKQVAAIKKTQYQSSLELSESETAPTGLKTNPGRNYADGGLIGGKRHAQGGTMIEAEQGEAIMTRGAVTQFAPLLSLMNQAGGGASFNSNLMTTRQDNPILNNPAQEQAPLIVKTYVVSQELTTEAHRQARLKNLSTI